MILKEMGFGMTILINLGIVVLIWGFLSPIWWVIWGEGARATELEKKGGE